MLSQYPIYAGLPVTDLERAMRWYGDMLGCKPSADPPIEANSEGLFLDAGRGTKFFLYRVGNHRGSLHTLAEFAVGDDLEHVVEELRARGVALQEDIPGLESENGIVSFVGADGKGAHRAAFFTDVDGNVLAIGSYGKPLADVGQREAQSLPRERS